LILLNGESLKILFHIIATIYSLVTQLLKKFLGGMMLQLL
jgi:hypothetical protein